MPYVSSNSQSLNHNVIFVLFIFLGFCLLTPNPILSTYALIAILVIFYNLWIPAQPPVLFIALAFQWLQASTEIIQANLAGVDINTYCNSLLAFQSVFSALTGLIIISISCKQVIKRAKWSISNYSQYLEKVNIKKLFTIYLLSIILASALQQFRIGGIAQIVYSIQLLKWGLYVILVFSVLYKKEKIFLLIATFSIEFISGFTGFFSDFRTVIIITVISVLTIEYKIDIKRILIINLFFMPVFLIFLVWTGIKGEYRNFLNQGTKGQVVLVSESEALLKLWELAKNFSAEDTERVLDNALDRLQYTKMIRLCMEYVPSYTEHTKGHLWLSSIRHVLVPRFLFPNKPILDDSEISRKYTGIYWSGRERGASIGIGYIAESYVDFGHLFMFVPLLLLGLFIGRIYLFFFRDISFNGLFDLSAVIPILYQFQLLERSSSKILGMIILSTIVYFVIIRPILSFLVKPFITK